MPQRTSTGVEPVLSSLEQPSRRRARAGAARARKTPAVLARRQADAAAPKSRSLSRTWRGVAPSDLRTKIELDEFPDFDDNLRQAMDDGDRVVRGVDPL